MKKSIIPAVWLILFASLLFTACNTGKRYDKPGAEELEKFAKTIGTHMEKSEWGRIDELIDLDVLMERALEPMNINFIEKANTQESLKAELIKIGFFKKLGTQVSRASLLKIKEVEGEQRPIYRLEMNGGVNYLEFIVIKGSGNTLKIADAYSYSAADNISSIFSSVFLNLITTNNLGFIDDNKTDKEMMNAITSLTQAHQQGKYEKVVSLYEDLPENIKKTKFALLMYLQAAQHVDENKYGDALTQYAKHYPTERGLNLLLIDKYFMEEKYSQSLISINALDSNVGGDPYLNLLRGNLHFFNGDTAASIQSFNAFITSFPKRSNGYEMLFYVYMSDFNYKEGAKVLSAWSAQTGENPMDAINMDKFPAFTYSEEFAAIKDKL